jgi:hypothetical protein
MSLTSDQRYIISVQLVSLLVEGFQADRGRDDGWERQLIRVFGCSYACNNTPMVEDAQDAHALCDEFFKSYYALLDWSQDRLEEHNQEISSRFAKYYESTELIGATCDRNVPVKLSSIDGSIPFAAFVRMERSFCRFAKERDLEMDEITKLISSPMNGCFGLFLTVWNEAEERIQTILIAD